MNYYPLNRTILKTPEGKISWPMPPGNKVHTWSLKLPPGLSCNHCILQVVWNPLVLFVFS